MVVFCAALAYFVFSSQSLRLDEAQSLWQTSRSPAQIINMVAKDVHVPLYHLLLYVWRLFLGNTVAIARAMSLVFYLLSIPAIYFLGKLAYSRNVGLFAALLLSISPFMNWYGSETRMYTLFTLVTILNQYFFIKIFTSKNAAPGSVSDHAWIGYGATVLLGIYTHYFFFLNLLAQAAFYFMRRPLFPPESLKRFLVVAGLVALAFSPWLYYVFTLGQAGSQEPLLSIPTTVNLFSTFSQFLFGFQDDHINTFFLSLWPVTIVLGFLTLRRTRIAPETEYFLTTIIIATTIAFGISVFIEPVFVSRYLIFTVPSLYLILTSVFNNYPTSIARLARITLLGLMIFTLVVEIKNPTAPVKEDYEQAVGYLNQHVSAQDAVAISAPFTIYPVEYYYRGPTPLYTLPIWDRYAYGPIPPFSESALPNDVAQIATDHQDIWVLLSYDQGYEKKIKDYFDNHYQRILSMNFSQDLNLYEYKLRYDTPLAKIEKGSQ